MPDKNDATIVESAAKGGVSGAMPYILLGGAVYLGYRYLKDQEWLPGQSIIDNISNTITETKKKVTETTKKVVDTYYYGGEVGMEVPNSPDEPIILPDGSTLGTIPGSTKYIKKNIKGDYFGLSGPVLVDSRSLTGMVGNETEQIMPDLTGIMDGSVTILDSKYNKDIADAQVEKYGLPNISTGATPKRATKTPTGPVLTDSEVSALKSSGKKPVTGPNTTGKIRVLSRPDKYGNRYDITDISTSRGRYR